MHRLTVTNDGHLSYETVMQMERGYLQKATFHLKQTRMLRA